MHNFTFIMYLHKSRAAQTNIIFLSFPIVFRYLLLQKE